MKEINNQVKEFTYFLLHLLQWCKRHNLVAKLETFNNFQSTVFKMVNLCLRKDKLYISDLKHCKNKFMAIKYKMSLF